MNGEISLSSFAAELMTAADQNERAIFSEELIDSLIDGHATDFVYNTLSLDDRRKHGIFFSGPDWAKKILSGEDLSKWKRFIDPSVGVGDLLLEICNRLPLNESINDTIESWSKCLVAIDLRKSFLNISWMRIQALAASRHNIEKNQSCNLEFIDLPENFIVGDALSIDLHLNCHDCIVMNPPYQLIKAPRDSFVGSGKRSAAALHLEHIVRQAPPGVGIYALIPDVLRSGSSYKNFRNELNKRAEILSFDPFGAFGSQADIDVSILSAITKKYEEKTNEIPAETVEKKVGDFFYISVGPVVPHRTPTNGNKLGYLTAKNAAIGTEILVPSEYATYNCRVEEGPFVIVRRTSSPSDKKRARSTLVITEDSLLVENHLLILKPKDKKVTSCQELIKILEDSRTDQWLNNHIRCRHLTVDALKKLPWIID